MSLREKLAAAPSFENLILQSFAFNHRWFILITPVQIIPPFKSIQKRTILISVTISVIHLKVGIGAQASQVTNSLRQLHRSLIGMFMALG